MTGTPAYAFDTISYAFRQRGDLPGEMARFYTYAGLAQDRFEAARRHLPAPKVAPIDRISHAETGQVSARWKKPGAGIQAPHPSHVVPSRHLEDRNWRQTADEDANPATMSREEFEASRKATISGRFSPRPGHQHRR